MRESEYMGAGLGRVAGLLIAIGAATLFGTFGAGFFVGHQTTPDAPAVLAADYVQVTYHAALNDSAHINITQPLQAFLDSQWGEAPAFFNVEIHAVPEGRR